MRGLDRIVKRHMEKYQIGSGTLALYTPFHKYQRKYGYAPTPQILMRVADLSKSVTRTVIRAIRLSDCLDETLYSFYQRAEQPLPEPRDERAKRITLRHLLNHTSGFDDSHFGCDPVINPKGEFKECQTIDQLLNYVLIHTTLASEPGTRYSDSNFGYCVLARMVELETKYSYLSWVRFVLRTHHVYLGSLEERHPGEIKTYDIVYPDEAYPLDRLTGAGNLVTDADTMASYAYRYFISGEDTGRFISQRISRKSILWGSLPGTDAYLFSWIWEGQKYSLCILFNKRVPQQEIATRFFIEEIDKFICRTFKLSFCSNS